MFSLDLCGCFRPRVWLRALWWNDDLSGVYCCPATIIFVLPNQPDFLLPSTTLFPVNANRLWGSSETFPNTPNPSTVRRSGKMVLFEMSAIHHSYPVRPLRRTASSRGGSWVCRYSRNMDAHYRHPQFLKLKSIPDTIFGPSFLAAAELVQCWPFVLSPCDWIRR